MLKYLIVQLSDNATSFCHYINPSKNNRLIDIECLHDTIVFALKHNLHIQYLMPENKMPIEMERVISKSDSLKIAASSSFYATNAQVVVHSSVHEFNNYKCKANQIHSLLIHTNQISSLLNLCTERLSKILRLNIVLQNLESFNQQFENEYKQILASIANKLSVAYSRSSMVELNILSDLLFLDKMNNCNAGIESICMAPNGQFYLCPAFYFEDPTNIIEFFDNEVQIKNKHLLKLDFAPICRICDAFHCKRCIWLNHKLTGEINTPSRQQCVISHLERNQSSLLLNNIRVNNPNFAEKKHFQTLDYLDPFEKIKR